MPDIKKGPLTSKETSGRKRKAQDAENTSKHIEVHVNVEENGAKVGASTDSPCDETPSTYLVAAMKEGFAQLSGNMANAISEAFKSFKSDLEVSFEENHESSESYHEDEPPAKKRGELGEQRSSKESSEKTVDIEKSIGNLLHRSNSASNEGKSEVLNSLKNDLQKEETGPNVDSGLASIINTLIKDGLPEEKLQDKMNKYHRPGNCESLTKVRVNQAVWDNLTKPVRSRDVRLQKVQTSLLKAMCALTVMINKLVDQIPSFPAGNELLQGATDAFALMANANTDLNHSRREFIKPDLHNDYKHLCSSSLAITDQLFRADLPKQVKDFTEVNRVGKKVTTNSGSFTRSPFDSRNPRNYASRSSSRGRGYRNTRKPFLGWRYNDRQTNPPRKTKQGKMK